MSIHDELPAIYRTERTQTDVDRIANEFYDAVLDANPTLATENGRKGVETLFGDYSPAAEEEHIKLVKKTLKALESVIPLDDTDLVTLDTMQERLNLTLEMHRAGLGEWQLNNIFSAPQSIRAGFDLMARETEQDWAHIAGRMANVPGAIDGLIQTLEQARQQGKISPRRQVETVIEQTDAYIADGGFFDTLGAEVSTAVPSLAEQAQQGAAAAREGYRTLNTYLRETLLPQAPTKDAVGRKLYALHLRNFLGANVNIEETYAWGVQELERIIAEQQAVASEIEPGASIERAKELLDMDPVRTLHGTDALQEWMQNRSDTAVQALAGTHFELGGPMLNLQCCIAPTHEGGIYYTGPSPDFSRPGRMWWSVPEGDETFGTWRETSTVYHEGVPGHHLQFSVAVAMAGTMNKWRSTMNWISGHGEGWALYAERLMEELGFLQDPGDHMGMLDAQRMRAARVVFDIGVHCELPIPDVWAQRLGVEPGTVWTPEVGYEFLTQNLEGTEGTIRFEFLRYLGWPGQAPSYKVGERLWLQLRQVALAEGESLRDFHMRALMLGSVGLDTLRRALTHEVSSDDDDDNDD